MRIVLLGAPGAGKGTQAEFICHKYNITKISTGDMLRAAVSNNTLIGQAVKEIMAKGQLVNDDLIIKLVIERITKADCENGFLLDGFPRNVVQAEALEKELEREESLRKKRISIDYVIEIKVPDEEIITRLSGRRTHLASGRVYHIKFNPPLKPDQDDVTGEPLVHREDDSEETIRKRLQIYHQQTEPLVAWYQEHLPEKLIRIQGLGSVQDIENQIDKAINQKRQFNRA